MNTIMNGLGAATLALASSVAGATTYAGNLGDPGNAALVGSDLGAPDFTDDNSIANNVALYTFTTSYGPVSIVSTGFAGGGVDPYFTLFAGSGSTATYLDSNYHFEGTDTGGDFTWTGELAAGTYEIALGSFENMSFAQNFGGGTLGDAFIMIGDPNSLGDGSYSLDVTTPVPEPSGILLMAAGFAALAARIPRTRKA